MTPNFNFNRVDTTTETKKITATLPKNTPTHDDTEDVIVLIRQGFLIEAISMLTEMQARVGGKGSSL